jgi:hypothetical protein
MGLETNIPAKDEAIFEHNFVAVAYIQELDVSAKSLLHAT